MATFTALNGAPEKSTEVINGSAEFHRAGSDERPNARPSSADARTAGEVSSSQRERESLGSSSHDRPPYPSASYPDVEGSHKRKRDGSDSPPRREHPLSPPERAETYGAHASHSEPRDHYSASTQRDYRPYADESREGSDHWHSQQGRDERSSAYEQPYSAGPNSAQSDDHQMGESLRRATAQMESGDYSSRMSPDGDDRSGMYSGQYTPEQRRDGVLQTDPKTGKPRKRNFSNRTKTGCLTCRKRKKKCDETKPECSNCMRGGFICQGYPPQRGTWPKPEAKPAQINIESKDPSYIPPGAYGMPQQPPPYANQPIVGQQKRDTSGLPYSRGQPLRIDPPQGRPLQTDDDRPTASTLTTASVVSPENKLSALSAYPNPANVFPTPISAVPGSALPKDTSYQRVPPLLDATRTDPDRQQKPPSLPPPSTQGTTLPQISLLRTSSPPSMSSQPPTSGVQATAQLALSHTFSSDRPRREKDEMLLGRPYYPFDKELVLERERCNAACWRFNNSTNPNLGVSPQERARLFRDILHPREGIQLSPSVTSPVTHTGRVGENATVEAPFNCDYGYNIHIGSNVSIGRNCLINDVCEVRIGNNVIISPNVCIYTGTCSTNPHRRNGNRGTQFGKPVVIEDDVWIAANAVILPGVRVGKGSTVAAGSVVTRDTGANAIVQGLKARFLRGIDLI